MKRMPVRILVVLVLFVACVFLVVSGVLFFRDARERALRSRCLAPLDCCLRKSMVMYSMDHGGAFPSNMAALADCGANSPKLFKCPGSDTVPGSMANVDEWMDYIYVYWQDGDKTPTNYPWIYERRLAHHGGKGLHVTPIAGPAFWDEGAQWFQKFAKEHPELKLRMPEELK